MKTFYPTPLSKATSRAVNAMGIIMFLKHDPIFFMRDLVVLIILGLIVFIGFFNILPGYKKPGA